MLSRLVFRSGSYQRGKGEARGEDTEDGTIGQLEQGDASCTCSTSSDRESMLR